jgi:hypothetical protein
MHPFSLSLGTIAAALLVMLAQPCLAASYYTWTDDKGELHISDSFGSVPEKYRSQLQSKRFENDSATTEISVPKGNHATGSSEPAEGFSKTREEKQLKKHRVRYIDHEGSAKRVIVSAVLNGSVSAKLAIDTGAPNTVIGVELAKKLGLFDNDHGKLFIRAGGIGGSAPAIRTIIDTIAIGGTHNSFMATTIVEKLSDAFEGLLGMDFLASYSMTIDSARKMVVFEELPSNPDHPAGRDKEWWSGLFREFASYRAEWKEYGEALDKEIRDSLISNEDDRHLKAFAEDQYREADKLFDKLNRHARENSVPMHWKQY